tara:strand:+ start:9330 stop:10082 length:753 start_codon:yes stop_codon:yes gene_type:complete
MKLSLITATYNSANTLKPCLESVINQDYSNIEYLMVDGGSKDETVSILNESQNQFSNLHWVSEPDKGIYDALNKGVSMATGDVIGFVHSDDFLSEPTIISQIMAEFNSKRVQGVYGDLHYIDKQNENKVIRTWKSCDFSPKLLQNGWMPPHPTLFLKKEVYQKHKGFNLDYKIAADYDFMLRVLQDPQLKFSYLPKVITKMRVGGASNRSLKNIIAKSREDYSAIKKNKLAYPIWVLCAKNISKIPQFFK